MQARRTLGGRLWREPFVRFLFVGVLNTAFGFGVYAILIKLFGLGRTPALAVAYILGVLFNFRTTGVIVFGSRDLRRILRFVVVYLAVYGINAAVLEGLKRAGVGPLVSQALCIPPVVVLTYALMKSLVFRVDTTSPFVPHRPSAGRQDC